MIPCTTDNAVLRYFPLYIYLLVLIAIRRPLYKYHRTLRFDLLRTTYRICSCFHCFFWLSRYRCSLSSYVCMYVCQTQGGHRWRSAQHTSTAFSYLVAFCDWLCVSRPPWCDNRICLIITCSCLLWRHNKRNTPLNNIGEPLNWSVEVGTTWYRLDKNINSNKPCVLISLMTIGWTGVVGLNLPYTRSGILPEPGI